MYAHRERHWGAAVQLDGDWFAGVTLTREVAVSSRHSVGPTRAEILMADRGDKNSANKKRKPLGGGREGSGLWEVVGGGWVTKRKKVFFFLQVVVVCIFSTNGKIQLAGNHWRPIRLSWDQ